MSLQKLGQKARKINIQLLALKEAQANSELIAELNRKQLEIGENADKKEVGRYTSTPYANLQQVKHRLELLTWILKVICMPRLLQKFCRKTY